jgi:thiol-disulfide isomerase/thioredoxin
MLKQILKAGLKSGRELLTIFRKQNNVVKVISIIAVVIVARYVANQLNWSIFSTTYVENLVGGKGSEMVLCHMTGCGHCKKMMPDWDKFSSSKKIKTRKIEVSQDEDFMVKHGVNSFPTILLLDEQGNKVGEYEGERNATGFAAYAAKVKSQ